MVIVHRITLTMAAALVCVRSAGAQNVHSLDDSQARLFLRYLAAVAAHRPATALVDSVMAAKGTALVIAQQNLSRRVSTAEYREVLAAAAEHREPRLSASDNDPRAAKGRDGLLQDVLPCIEWGAANVATLSSELTALHGANPGARARSLALGNLPDSVSIDVPMFLVMGGRAGAAAPSGGIYFDVLTTSCRAPRRVLTAESVTEYFAHEMHHVGLEQIIERREQTLHFDSASRRAMELLHGLVMEGSASYLINGHRDLAAMRRDPAFAAPGTDRERMELVERILSGVLEGHWTATQFDEAMTGLSGNALHITGAEMLDAIWQAMGRDAVMAVLEDPRLLLARYDDSVRTRPGAFRFSSGLARRVARLGEWREPRRPAP